MAYQILLVDRNVTLPLGEASSKHTYRVPGVGEHLVVRWQGETKVCEVEDIWTHINLDKESPYQGAVQVLVRWSLGLDPALYAQRFR